MRLLGRAEVVETATASFRRAYPDAPPHMIETAVFHVFRDGVGAAIEWVAAAERFLRNPVSGFDCGATSHAVYHLHNWQQFQALLPVGRDGVLERLADIKRFLSENDPGAESGFQFGGEFWDVPIDKLSNDRLATFRRQHVATGRPCRCGPAVKGRLLTVFRTLCLTNGVAVAAA